jgi:hypothetical protein
MGMTCLVVCATCPAVGPPIGDFGYLGRPSMDTTPAPGDAEGPADGDDLAPFGFFYQTLHDVGINTDELEAMADFLRKHQGHRLSTAIDAEFSPPVDDDVVEALKDWGDEQPLGYKETEARVRGGFLIGEYTLECRCGQTLSTQPTILCPLSEVLWTPPLLERFRQMFVNWDVSSYHLTEPLIAPSTEADAPLCLIEAFVSRHVSHGVTARILRSNLDSTPDAPVPAIEEGWPVDEPATRPDRMQWVLMGGGVLAIVAGLWPLLSGGEFNVGFVGLGALMLVSRLLRRRS